MSDKRKRRENLITALLIAGMCIVIGVTIVFVVKFAKKDKDSDIKQLTPGMTEASDISDESAEDTSSSEEGPTGTPTPVPTDTPTPSPTLSPTPTNTPTPTPTPKPKKLESLSGYDPGDVIDSDKIDRDNLSQYFTSSEIVEGDSVYNRIYGKSYVSNSNIGSGKSDNSKVTYKITDLFDEEYWTEELHQ